MKVKLGVVVFPGSNCDDDMVYVLQDIMEQEVVKLWHKDKNLQDVKGVFLPGGFSYGDYLRSGAIARFSPIMESVIAFANKGGFVFGVCNGFQILCESGLLPGTLLHNDKHKFICKNVFIKAETNKSMVSREIITTRALKIPIAHGEGKYYAPPETIRDMRQNGQIIFRYCDQYAKLSSESNPNGSIENIAGICNATKNVFGMMPHPERAADDELGNTDGVTIFESIIKSII